MMDMIFFVFIALVLIAVRPQESEDTYLSPKNMLPIRGIMAVTIILHHLFERVNRGKMLMIMLRIGYPIVAVFFFLSGYGLMVSRMTRGKDYLKDFWKNRILYLMAVFALATVVYTIYHLIVGDFKPKLTIVANSWYVVVQLLLYIVFWCAFKIAGGVERGILLVFLAQTVMMAVMYAIGMQEIWYISNYAFSLGLVVARYKTGFDRILCKHYIAMLVASLAGFGLFSYFPLLIPKAYAICRMASTLFFCLLMVVICRKFTVRSKIWNYLGTISLEIYLYHGLVYMILRKMIANDVMWTIMTVAVSIFVAHIAYRFDTKMKEALKT